MSLTKERIAYLDVLRVLSVLLVMYGHFVAVGGGAMAIPGIVSEAASMPIIDQSQWSLWRFEVFLVEMFSSQSAVLGVSIFFLITGYLMPQMLEKYSRMQFLVNRFFRIYPVLVVGTVCIGVFLKQVWGIKFSVQSYLSSWSLLYLFVGVVPVAGVLWTLLIEVLFYMISAIIGSFTLLRLYAIQGLLLMVLLLSAHYPDHYYMMLCSMQAKYLLMVCVGSSVYLAEKESVFTAKFCVVSSAAVIAYTGFQLFKMAHNEVSTYSNLGTHAFALIALLSLKIIPGRLIRRFVPGVVTWLSELVYPIYIVHASLGLASMAYFKRFMVGPYVLLLIGIAVSIVVAAGLHYLIEKPGIAKGRKIIKALRKHQAAILVDQIT